MATPEEWFNSLPKITRAYMVAAVATTTAVSLGLASPRSLYWSAEMFFSKFQIWRAFTSLTFFGPFSLGFLFQVFILVRYSSMLEPTPFVPGGGGIGSAADYAFMLIFGQVAVLLIATFMDMPFPGTSLVFMMLYVWSRKFPEAPASFFGFRSTGIYLPWIMLAFSVLIGQSPVPDLVGIAAGHLFYFLVEEVPRTYNKHLLATPRFLRRLIDGDAAFIPRPAAGGQRLGGGGGGAAAADIGLHRWGAGRPLGTG